MSGYCTGGGGPTCVCQHCFSTRQKEDLFRYVRQRDLDNDYYNRPGYTKPLDYDPYRRAPTYTENDRLKREIDLLRDDVRRLNTLVEKLISIFLPGESKVP